MYDISSAFPPFDHPERLEKKLKLFGNGYDPIPVFEKDPKVYSWSEDPMTEERIVAMHRQYCTIDIGKRPQKNIGIRTSQPSHDNPDEHVIAVDSDMINPDHHAASVDLAEARLGPTPLVRFGSKGGVLLYRCIGDPFKSYNIRGRLPTDPFNKDGSPKYPHGVEILGWHRQVVVFGRHPKGTDYQWIGWRGNPGDIGPTPLDIPYWELPLVTVEQVHELAGDIAEALPMLGYRLPPGETYTGGNAPSFDDMTETAGSIQQAHDITRLFVDRLPRGRMNGNGWYDFDCPACDAGRHQKKGGFIVLASGGWKFKCWKSGCDYSRTTGWEPPATGDDPRNLGSRETRLYELLGGNSADLPRFTTIRDRHEKEKWQRLCREIEDTDASAYEEEEMLLRDDPPTEDILITRGNEEIPGEPKNAETTFDPKARRLVYFDEYEAMPEINYFDPEIKIMPRVPGGSIILFCGLRGSHKTGVAIVMALEAVLNHGARALYLAAEGQFFFGKARMPSYCQAYDIELRDLRDRFMFWPHGLNLNDPKDVAGFMEAVGDFAPDIIIIDTLAQVTPGVDSNSSLKGDIFGYSGPLGAMRQAWDSLVIMNCHPPKSNPRDILGHSSIVGNTDAVLINEYDREAGLITVTVERYKHGPEGGKLYFKVDPTQLPVPRMIPESELPEKSGNGDDCDKPSFDINEALAIRTVLGEYDLTSQEMKINNRRMAELLTPQGNTGDMQKTWKQRVEKKLKQLKNIQTNKVGKPGCPFNELTEQDEVGHWWWWDRGFVSAKTVRDQFSSLFDSQLIGSA